MDEELKQIKPSVTYLCWDQSDRWVITACTDMTIKVWDSNTTELLQVMTGHKKEVYVLESHPFHSKVKLNNLEISLQFILIIQIYTYNLRFY